jgi:Domain of unknown function (DUF4129)
MGLQLRLFLAGALLIPIAAGAQAQGDAAQGTVDLRSVTIAEYKGHLESLKALVAACEKNPIECDSKKVGADERVEGGSFQAHWSWLRDALSSAHNPDSPDRAALLQQAAARLNEDATLADRSNPQSADAFQRARKQADDVLSRSEFRTVEEHSYLERQIARFWQWVNGVFSGVSRFGQRSPWLVPVMEWGAMTLAAAFLLTWVFRTMQRQRLAVRIESRVSAEVWQKESNNWAELARAEAAKQNWRAAVHCLYWAAIVMLEGRRLWRQNRARTPREYVLLLEPGSGVQQSLRRLTQIFERIWYGLRPAAESDYASAQRLFDELRSA